MAASRAKSRTLRLRESDLLRCNDDEASERSKAARIGSEDDGAVGRAKSARVESRRLQTATSSASLTIRALSRRCVYTLRPFGIRRVTDSNSRRVRASRARDGRRLLRGRGFASVCRSTCRVGGVHGSRTGPRVEGGDGWTCVALCCDGPGASRGRSLTARSCAIGAGGVIAGGGRAMPGRVSDGNAAAGGRWVGWPVP